MKIKTPPLWINSQNQKVSYRRVFKVASSSIVNMLGIHTENDKAFHQRRFTVIREPIERAVSIYNQVSRYKDYGTIYDFYTKVKQDGFWDAHQMPQVWFIGGNDVEIFTTEQMQEVADFIGFPGTIPILNKSESYPEITPETLELILEIYSEDFELWAYYVNL